LEYTTGQWQIEREQVASPPLAQPQSDCPALCYHQWTPHAVPIATILLVHGLGEHASRYATVAKTFVEKGFEVIGYDQCGHGLTGGPLPGFDALLSDLDRVTHRLHFERETLIPNRKLFLYGQSMGGGLVLRYALTNPAFVAGVVLSSPLIRTAAPPPAWKLWIGRTLGRHFPQLSLGTSVRPAELTRLPDQQLKNFGKKLLPSPRLGLDSDRARASSKAVFVLPK